MPRPGAINTAYPINWSHPLNRGLVWWWMAGLSNPGGTRARDLLGRNHGTLTNFPAGGPTYAGCPNGFPSLIFDGSDDYISVPDNSVLNVTGDMTIEVVHLQTSASNTVVIGRGTYGGGGWYCHTNEGGKSMAFTVNATPVGPTGSLTLNKWYHHVCTVNGTTATVYEDGAEVASGTVAAVSSYSGALEVGRYGGSGYHYGGRIQSARLFNRGVSADFAKRAFDSWRQGFEGASKRSRRVFAVPVAGAGSVGPLIGGKLVSDGILVGGRLVA